MKRLVISLFTLTIAILLSFMYRRMEFFSTLKKTAIAKNMVNYSPRLPVYFLSHGGPTFMYENSYGGDAGAFRATKKLGHYIKDTLKPDFIIVVSAHWQSRGSDLIEIGYPQEDRLMPSSSALLATDENELIYDFYGFPEHMYQEQFHTRGSKSIAQDISVTLNDAGFKTKLTARGIDHGVWVPFKVAFTDSKSSNSNRWDVDVPVVQVSLTSSHEHDIHHQLGKALSPYRDRNALIICSGMSVHNLRDLNFGPEAMPYVEPFSDIVTNDILTTTGQERLTKFNNLFIEHGKLYKKAHPTNEHFMPIVVASGAAENEIGKEIYNNASGSLGWGIYEFNN